MKVRFVWDPLQVSVQRSLASKTLSHAKGGSLLAAYLKILPFFAIMLPGMISRILFPGNMWKVCLYCQYCSTRLTFNS